ncbi:MAG TPA: phosphotransferase family protein [Candidatus Binatia bacterium]|nr:phosphotransferase family protein [Candidatus Binatia bacterium]
MIDRSLHADFLTYLRRVVGEGVEYRGPLRQMTGGFVTDVYAFDLVGAPSEWAGPLVLRIYPDGTEPSSIRREQCAQEVVWAQGVPAPRVLACEDTAGALGRPFMVMERLPGRAQMSIEFPGFLAEIPRLFTLGRRHAAAMRMVHVLDAEPLIEAFAAAGIDRRSAGPEHWLDGANATIDRWGFDGLRAALEWLRANRPPDPERLSICHGDLFGANILERDGRVTGILDWNLVTVSDAAFDVGGQLAAYQMSPLPGPAPLRWIATGAGQLMARDLQREYAKLHAIDPDVVRYYAVMRAFTELTFKIGLQAESRATGIVRRMPTWKPEQCARYFRRRTDVSIDLE